MEAYLCRGTKQIFTWGKNPKALERLERAVKDVHAAAMMCKGDSWTLHEELMHEKEDLRRILKRMEAQWLEEANR